MTGASGAELLALARSCEVGLHLTDRTAALDAVDARPDAALFRVEVAAERAIDAARMVLLDEAEAMAREVLGDADASPVATARATEAWGRVLAWRGTDASTLEAERVLTDAAAQYAALEEPEWQGYVLFWMANSVHLQNGRLAVAEDQMRAALDVLAPDSPRRATVASYLGDVLVARGSWADAELVLADGAQRAAQTDDATARAYVAWSRARMASARGDARQTERHLLEAERDSAHWFDTHVGPTFLADAAELMDRVGQHAAADDYLRRASERLPEDPFVQQAHAALLARRGDPDAALELLQDLSRGSWLEKRLLWRHSLLAAYATLRAGRSGAPELAARAFEQAEANGGVQVATATEPDLCAVLLPLAEDIGSVPARYALAGDGGLIVRLFNGTRISGAQGDLTLPPGQAAELVRMLAVRPEGIPVDAVTDQLFPGVAAAPARQRLRQVLTRLRAGAGDVVRRDGDVLRLVPAWVDLREFRAAADRALRATPDRGAERAYAALALWTGPPLPTDPYAGWATLPREQVRRRYLALLDLVVADARRRGSTGEALHALALAREEDPYDESRYVLSAELLVGSGRRGAAVLIARQAQSALADIAVPVPDYLAELLRDI